MRKSLVLLLVLSSFVAACGSQLSTEELTALEGERTSAVTKTVEGVAGAEPSQGQSIGQQTDGSGQATSRTNPTATPDSPAASNGANPGSPGQAAGPVTPGSPVRIGFVGTLSGPAGVNIAPIRDGVQVWVNYINGRGGVNGHMVELVVADDRGDSTRHRSLVQRLVEEQGVMAFVGNADVLLGPVSVDYLTGKGVPRIGGDTGGGWMYDSPVFFPQASSGLALLQAGFASVAQRAVADNKTRVAVIACQEAQVCRDGARMYPRLAPTYGVDLVYSATSSIAQLDFTAECLNAKKARAQVVIVSLDANSIDRVAASCARQGFHPTYAWNASLTVDAQKDNEELQGALIAMNVAPWTEAATPALTEFREAMATYLPTRQPSAGHITGWTAAVLFGRGASNLPEPPTSEGILEGMYKISDDDLGGLTYPLTFAAGENAPRVVCWWGVRITDGRFVADGGFERKCDEYRV